MSLVDSFLADLEDIESEEVPKVLPSEVPADQEVDVPVWPSLLDDAEFQNFCSSISNRQSGPASALSRASEEYLLISKSSEYIPLIDRDIYAIYRNDADIFAKRFPELEQIVLSPFDYLRVVERFLQSSSILETDFSDLVPTNLAVAITVTASTSRGSGSLSRQELGIISSTIQVATQLNNCKQLIIEFLISQMPFYAPNLSILLGPLVAAQLVSAAGGLENLATMPSQNIEAVGAHKQAMLGLSGASRSSLVAQTDLVANCSDEDARKRAMRLVVGRTAIAARVDRFGSDRDGATGARLRQEIEAAVRKAAELPPARAAKALPIPEIEKPKSRRGGRRARMWKEKYGLTEVQKRAGRIQFGSGQDGDMDVDGTVASSKKIEMGGRIRAVANKATKPKPASSGVQSNDLAFTATAGMEFSLSLS